MDVVMLQHKKADELLQVKLIRYENLLRSAAKNRFKMERLGKGIHEIGIDQATGKTIIKIDAKYFRPTEVDFLLGDPSKAEKELGWKAKIKFHTLATKLIKFDYELAKKEKGRIFY